MRLVLAASDRSGGSTSLFRTAARIAEASGAALHVLQTTWPMRTASVQPSAGESLPEAMRTLCGIEGPVEVDLCEKPLREAVLDRCVESPADLVVLESSGPYGGSLMAPHLDVVQIAVAFVAFVDSASVVTTGAEHDAHEWLGLDEAVARVAWPRARANLRDAHALLGSGDAGPVEDVLRVR